MLMFSSQLCQNTKLVPPDVRCQILRLKCTKFDFRWGSAPDTAAEAYSAPPDLLAEFKTKLRGPTSKRRGRGVERKGRGRERRAKGREREGGAREKCEA